MNQPTTLLQHRVLAYLEEHPLSTSGDVASALQLRPSTTKNALDGLYTRGLVGRQSSLGRDSQRGNNGVWYWKSARTVAEVGS